jgi:hypothetical protein
MLGGLLKSQEINVTDSSRQSHQSAYDRLRPLTTVHDRLRPVIWVVNLFTNRKQIDHAVHVSRDCSSSSTRAVTD